MRLWFVALVLACSGDKQPPPPEPPPRPPPVVVDAAPVPLPTVLEAARDEIATAKERDPLALVLLAHAQAAAEQTAAAKETLAEGLAAASAESAASAEALVHGVDVLAALGDEEGAAKLLDEASERLAGHARAEEVIVTLLTPLGAITHPPVVERLATVAAQDKYIAYVTIRIAPSSPAWALIAGKVREREPVEDRLHQLVQLAIRARLAGEPTIAKTHVLEAAALVDEQPDLAGTLLVQEAAFAGEETLAKRVLAQLAKRKRKKPVERAAALATTAKLYAMLGDAKASAKAESQALAAAASVKGRRAKDAGVVGDEVWRAIAVARALRGDVDGALAFAKQHGDAVIGGLATVLAVHGKDDAVRRALALLNGDALAETVTAIVELQARRGELDAAAAHARSIPPRPGELHPMVHVLRAAAVRGELAKVRELGPSYPGAIDGFIGLAAGVRARAGSCEIAVSALDAVRANRGETLAVIARYCPDSRL